MPVVLYYVLGGMNSHTQQSILTVVSLITVLRYLLVRVVVPSQWSYSRAGAGTTVDGTDVPYVPVDGTAVPCRQH